MACRSKTNPNECKHGAPWTNRLNLETPVLICQGLAKKFKLRCSGARNWLGQMLGVRNDEWVNGCMPAMCVAFSGSNSDVKANDRLPIIAATHETICTNKNMCQEACIKTNHTHCSACTKCYKWLLRRIYWKTTAHREIRSSEMC